MSVHVCTLPGFLSPEDCEAALKLFPDTRQASVLDTEATPVERKVRSSRVSFLASKNGGYALVQRIRDIMLEANRDVYHFELCGMEPLQLAEYGEGNGYDWHIDTGPGSSKLRKLSASIQLTSQADYEGGVLEMWGNYINPSSRAQGSIIIFPSFLLHRVVPVTRGLRRSLVAWAIGDRPFR